MIVVRPFAEDDKPAIAAMHAAQGFHYDEPDWSRMLLSAVVEVDGRVEMAAFLRKSSEAYLLLTPQTNRRGQLGQILMLHRELLRPAKRVGFEDVHCFLPPEIAAKFGKLLMHMGWEKPLWTCFSRRVE